MSRPTARAQNQPAAATGAGLSVQVHAPSENFLLLSSATGVSRDGVFVRASRPLPLGTEVRLDLSSHGDAERVSTFGKVIRVQDGPGVRGMEMAFMQANGARSEALARLLDRFED